MCNQDNHIVVFEHEALRFDKGEKRISKPQFDALQKYYGSGVPYFKLIYNGVQFNEYVGVIQIGKTTIEVLPKADKNSNSTIEENKWRDILIGMMRSVGSFNIKSTSSSNLKIKPNSILDLYFEMFINEVEYILHSGLIKKYRKKKGNVLALKGSLQFNKHIQYNLTHQERFYVSHTTYDVVHQLHIILYQAIQLIKQINSNTSLHSRIGSLLLNFPEMPNIKVTESTFNKLIFNRKTEHYKKGIEIAKLLLLQYHPDISKGRNNVLALMFDMNMLWEKFIFKSLLKYKNSQSRITAQTSKYFWKPEKGNRSKMKPDIWIENDGESIILDTKWKNLNGYNPSPDDLRQMYVYHEYYKAQKVALVYPGVKNEKRNGLFLDPVSSNPIDKECGVITIEVDNNIKKWQENISEQFNDWLN
ncbi:McrC family protein [Zobellia alginiliquefaciens]|uniref:McrC family protein n=1 Tax=Zobellia alginiliquefaciens TaxID=3032586 RepID=UPI0023E3EBB9|nr:restriction endonuclease [Zobellia alginiliquefaciens]